MKKVDNLNKVLEKHQKWLKNEEGGSRADLSRADLSGADLSGADLSEADLSGANLSGADLSRANFFEANLSGADLSGANLSRADLSRADLSGAKNIDMLKWLPDLYILKEQPPRTKLFAYKFLNKDLISPYQNFQYEIGKIYTADGVDTDERNICGAGLNVATLAWCKRNMNPYSLIIKVSFYAKDIIAIPFATDGKFRVKRMKVEEILAENTTKGGQ